MVDLARPRLADEVAAVLREMIVSGELPPGTQLLQIELSKRLGVSRTPLREAFRTLEYDGLVRISNGNKTVEVVPVDIDRVIETYQVREIVDGLAARLLARRGLRREDDTAIQRCLLTMEQQVNGETPVDSARYGEAHSTFHSTIVEKCGNSQLQGSLALVRMSSHMQTYRLVQHINHEHPTVAASMEASRLLAVGNDDHRAIYDAIVGGRAREAETAATRHIRKATRFIEEIRNELDAEAALTA
jgi:GntR family transcriptional regulator, vanillate catabolism transcriptional regulator